MNVLLTGATGFIGKSLATTMLNTQCNVCVILRKKADFPDNVKQFCVGDFADNPDFYDALKGIDCVIHLAGKAHVIDKSKAKVLDEFRKINTDLTLNLAKQAADAGVKRLVFLSSIRVNGNQNNQPFLESDTPNPQEPYAISKFEAEQGLLKIAQQTNLEVVIIRPPLVYGADAPGNFGRLIDWVKVKTPLPLPLGAVHNQRSLVAIDNLIDFIMTCTAHQKAANEIFLIADGQNLSTTQLLQKLGRAFNKKVILLSVPVKLMIFFARLIGRQADAIRLFSSLQVDSSKARNLLNWQPVVSVDEQLIKIADETNS